MNKLDNYCEEILKDISFDASIPLYDSALHSMNDTSKKVFLKRCDNDLMEINRITEGVFLDNVVFEALKLHGAFVEFANTYSKGYSSAFDRYVHNLHNKVDRYENNFSDLEISIDDLYATIWQYLTLYDNIGVAFKEGKDFSTMGVNPSLEEAIYALSLYSQKKLGDIEVILEKKSKKKTSPLSKLGKVLTKKDNQALNEEVKERLRYLLNDYFVLLLTATYIRFKDSI